VRATIGDALDCSVEAVEVLDTREWSGDAVVAGSFRSGHVLLAGDAAHRMWPSGGHGMNTGLGDVANLGWKLDAVLSGWAPDALLDTYTAERRPHCETDGAPRLAQLRADNAILPDPTLDDPGKSRRAPSSANESWRPARPSRRSLGASSTCAIPSRHWSFRTALPSRPSTPSDTCRRRDRDTAPRTSPCPTDARCTTSSAVASRC